MKLLVHCQAVHTQWARQMPDTMPDVTVDQLDCAFACLMRSQMFDMILGRHISGHLWTRYAR